MRDKQAKAGESANQVWKLYQKRVQTLQISKIQFACLSPYFDMLFVTQKS